MISEKTEILTKNQRTFMLNDTGTKIIFTLHKDWVVLTNLVFYFQENHLWVPTI